MWNTKSLIAAPDHKIKPEAEGVAAFVVFAIAPLLINPGASVSRMPYLRVRAEAEELAKTTLPLVVSGRGAATARRACQL